MVFETRISKGTAAAIALWGFDTPRPRRALAGVEKNILPRRIKMSNKAVKSVVLVHGGFVDGSGWEGVYKDLTKKGFKVSIVQNPTISLPEDVAVTKRVIAAAEGDVILVGHSYGGVVITEAGNDPKVAGLVYITA